MDINASPKLSGDRIRLRGLRDEDVLRRAALGRAEEVVRGFGGDGSSAGPMSEDEASAALRFRFGPGPHWVIADEDDQFIGIVRLAPIDEDNRSARFAIGILDPALLGQGLGSDATRVALEYGFGSLDLHRISLTVLARNARAIASYERCGFVHEGRLRQTLFLDGEWQDDLAMAILAPDWRRLVGARGGI